MPQRTRKFIGMLVLIAFVAVYALLVVALATSRLMTLGAAVTVMFYAGAGLLWVPPAAWIIHWMQRR